MGNALNMADMSPVRDFEHLPPFQSGTVRLYVSSANPEHLDINQMHPAMTAEAPVSMTIQPVLETLADIYSPVKGLHLFQRESYIDFPQIRNNVSMFMMMDIGW
jgi:hypothetical protein